jgi:hypothetical protein
MTTMQENPPKREEVLRETLANITNRLYDHFGRVPSEDEVMSFILGTDVERLLIWNSRPLMTEDTQPMPEDCRMHAMERRPEWNHVDGRKCFYHYRLGKYTPDGLNECLREHPSRDSQSL